jgi:hypothetical protein
MTFSITDGRLDLTNFLLKVTLGEDWKKLFDIIMIQANFPLFQRAR